MRDFKYGKMGLFSVCHRRWGKRNISLAFVFLDRRVRSDKTNYKKSAFLGSGSYLFFFFLAFLYLLKASCCVKSIFFLLIIVIK